MYPARLAAVVLVAASLPGCWSGPRPVSARKPVAPARTPALPAWAVAACDSLPELRGTCVDRAPAGSGGFWQMVIERPRPGWRVAYVVLRHGSTSIVAGEAPASRGLRTFGLAPALRRPVSDWLSVATATAVNGGARRWGGVTGQLVLTRSAGPVEFRDLLAFTWIDGPWRRVIAIGAFGPFDQAVATLREIVNHRPITPPSRELVPSRPAAGIAMVATPRWLRLLCGQALRRACPTRMPAPSSEFALVQAEADSLDLTWGGETGRPAGDRPPQLVHLTVSAGPRRAARPLIALGRRHWTTPPGVLSIGARGCFANHACYAWADGGRSYRVSLHAWRPPAQTLAVFARVVRSIPGR